MLPSLLNKIYSWKRYFLFKAFYIFSLFLLTFSFPTFAQVYPVQLSTQLLPPYSGYLPDYGDPTNEKLKCIIMLNDFSITHRDVKLEITITGNGFTIQTNPTFFPSPITIYPGVPEIITGIDLAPYLETQNLIFTGINVNDYEQRKVLPEGYYSICIKVIDYYQPDYTILSNASCTSAWFYLADPPFLNFPQCNSTITPTQPQNIFFQWTPMNLSSPNSVMNTEYLFELFEVRPASTPPNDIVLTTAPIFSITTSNSFYNYGIIDPLLYTGMQYVWRVRAIDLTGRDYFKNEGYSQICTFTYGNPQNTFGEDAFSLTLNGQASTHRQIKYWWNNIANFTEYKLQIRKTGTQNWFDYSSNTSEIKISPLEPSTSYEARVMGIGEEFESDWSNTVTVSTNPFPTIVCNDQNITINALSAQPLLTATPNMIMKIGQFEMYVTSISPFGTNPGYYSGYGYILYYFKKIGVQFDNVYINDNLEITNGNVVALTEGVDAWVDNWMLDEAIDDAFHVDGTITNIYLDEDSSIAVVNDLGDTTVLTFPPNDHPVVVQDDSGNQYIVYPDGTIVPGTYLEFSTDILEATKNNQIVFEKSNEQTYGFDPFQYGEWHDDYEVIQLSDETKYFIPNKSIEKNKTDLVRAKINAELYSTGVIQFKNQLGTSISHSVINDSVFEITLPASQEDYSVYAFAGNLKLGKLNVKVYEKKNEKVVLVALGNQNLPNENDVENYLNTVYKTGIVNWEVSTANALTISNWDENANGKIDIDDYSLLNKYSSEMDAIRNAFDEEVDDDTYVLIIVPGFGDATVDGYMPYGRKYGFIKANAELKSYAHELGHGAFGMQHTFPDIPQGSTDNLMDYGSGNHLATFQWDWMRESHWLENMNSDMTEIEYSSSDELSPWLNINDQFNFTGFAFPFINGKTTKINHVKKVKFNRYGQVYEFALDNNKKYRAITGTNSWFFGFVETTKYQKYAGKILTAELNEQLKVDLVPDSYFTSTNNSDSTVTYARKKEGDFFINCHYICKWKNNAFSSVSTSGSWQSDFTPPENKIIVGYDNIDNCTVDLSAEGVNEGVGVKLYLSLFKDYEVGSTERNNLVALANYFSEKVGEKKFAFYVNDEIGYYSAIGFSNEIINFFKDNEINSLSEFHAIVPYDSDYSREFEIIFSFKNLRNDLAADYNRNSIDYSQIEGISELHNRLHNGDLVYETFFDEMREIVNQGNYQLYEYSYRDLILRRKIFDQHSIDVQNWPWLRDVIWTQINANEVDGLGGPICDLDGYDQYYSMFATNSAYWLGCIYTTEATVAAPGAVDAPKIRMSSRLRAHASNRIGIKPSGGQSTFKKGDIIAEVQIRQLRNGSNGKVVVIGRSMNSVKKVGSELKSKGYEIELFDKNYFTEDFKFIIEGNSYSWDEITLDMKNGNYIRDPITNHVLDIDLPNTLMFKSNKIWANKIKSENYTILDIGNPENISKPSLFYNMELFTIFD